MSFKTFDDGTIVAPAASAAHGDWHIAAAPEKPAAAGAVHDEPAPTGIKAILKRKKKGAAAADEGDGKAGIPGAVFNLANAVRCAAAGCGRAARSAPAPATST